MDDDTELTELTSPANGVWPHAISANELVAGLFARLAAAAEAEQRRALALGVRESPAKQRRRARYLDPQMRSAWQARSSAFLTRRPEVARRLSLEALCSAVAMQHLVDLDAADALLPEHQRCSEDTYAEGLSSQFLLDVPRCRYVVEEEVFHLATLRGSRCPDGPEQDAAAVARRLTEALRHATPRALLERVTTTMSQSGLAALERASRCGAAVSGGSQQVAFTLRARESTRPAGVDVTLEVRRRGFLEYFAAPTAGAEAAACDSDSSIRKAATVEFSTDGSVDVVDFVEEVCIRRNGCTISPESLSASSLEREILHGRAQSAGRRGHARWAFSASCARYWFQRARLYCCCCGWRRREARACAERLSPG